MTKKESKKEVITMKRPKANNDTPLCPISGSRNEDFLHILANQVIHGMWMGNSDAEAAASQKQACLVAMMGVAPKDELEGMVAAQMVAAHNATMECFKRAMIPEQSVDSRDYNLNHAGKLMRAYAGMMEALGRYRGKGQQKMTVEHVHVHAGGQAIVGNINHPEGGGVQNKTEELPHAKQITHAPEQTLPSQNASSKKRQAVPATSDA